MCFLSEQNDVQHFFRLKSNKDTLSDSAKGLPPSRGKSDGTEADEL